MLVVKEGPYREDLMEVQALLRAAEDIAPDHPDAGKLRQEADRRMQALAGALIRRELPGTVFPPPMRDEALGLYVCGGHTPEIKAKCRELVWLYPHRPDDGGRLRDTIEICLSFDLDIFCGAFPPRPQEMPVERD